MLKVWPKLSRVTIKSVFEIPIRCDTNRAVQEQNMDRGIEFRIKEVQSLYYQSSEKIKALTAAWRMRS